MAFFYQNLIKTPSKSSRSGQKKVVFLHVLIQFDVVTMMCSYWVLSGVTDLTQDLNLDLNELIINHKIS